MSFPPGASPMGSPVSSAHSWGPHHGQGARTPQMLQGTRVPAVLGAHVSTDTRLMFLNGSGHGHPCNEPKGEIRTNTEGNTSPL